MYWLICLIPVVLWAISGLQHPQLSLEIMSKTGETAARANHYLLNLPGSYLIETKPSGNVLIHAVKGSLYLKLASGALLVAAAVLSQGFVMAIAHVRHNRAIFFGVVILWGFLSNRWDGKEKLVENCALWVINHPIAYLMAFVVAATIITVFSLRKFVKIEHP